MDLIKPELGLLFWMVVSFLLVFFLLKKFAWTPILEMLKERETSIENALQAAEKAKLEMARLQANNEQLIQEAKAERDAILKSARDAKEMMISEAKAKATEEADRLIKIARENINNEKMAAITDLKNQVANLSVEIAEKLIKVELSNKESQKDLINKYLEEAKLN
ncbi:MAG: F0F1 ATP synthase subunit B [Sphingobacteriales bacterium JAD_PAG50586_3]|nr:MAG: F0F1 ATP synthase subunit B [Sphingobacteriales bacterium JAD_PAG50586_3]